MSDGTKIEWTDATWNPITGCTLVDDGCRICYAAELAATRLKNHPSRAGLARRNRQGEAKFTGEVRFNKQWLPQPLRWTSPRMIFVCAHGDLFHENVPDAWIDQVFAVMAMCPHHTFQVLTKRPERAAQYLDQTNVDDGREIAEIACDVWQQHRGNWRNMPSTIGHQQRKTEWGNEIDFWLEQWPLPNVWLGTSVSDQASANARIPQLLQAPAAIRFVSAEPLLGPVDLTHIVYDDVVAINALTGEAGVPVAHRPSGAAINWVIAGGESGRSARVRPMHPDWVRAIAVACNHHGTAFHFKQWGMYLHQDQAGPSLFDGSPIDPIDQWDWADADERGAIHHWPDGTASIRLKKHEAGRLLDGRIWDQFPEALS